jgi:hypothetical protein
MRFTQDQHSPRGISRRAFLGSAAISSLGLMGASCNNCGGGGPIMFPTIREFVPGTGGELIWRGSNNTTKILRTFVDNVRPDANIQVSVGVSRHRPWTSSSYVRHFPVARDTIPGEPADSTSRHYTFQPPHPEDYKDTQQVFFKWFVDVRQANGEMLLLAESPQRSFRIGGFTPTQTDELLRAVQASVVERFDRPDLSPAQHGVPTHLNRCLRGMGITFLRHGRSFSGSINPMEPQLLLYRADLSRLMGWAYGMEHTGIGSHPIVAQIPWEAWFVHEAGWHPLDGGFIPTPPSNDFPRGSLAAPAPDPPVGPGFWHPRIWDLHVFRRDGGTPLMRIEDPAVERSCEDWDPAWFFDASDVDVQPRA